MGITVTLSERERREACERYMDPQGADFAKRQMEARLSLFVSDLLVVLDFCRKHPEDDLTQRITEALGALR